MPGGKQPMTQSDASRIQSGAAKGQGDQGFAQRAQSAGDRNANAGIGGGHQQGSGTQGQGHGTHGGGGGGGVGSGKK